MSSESFLWMLLTLFLSFPYIVRVCAQLRSLKIHLTGYLSLAALNRWGSSRILSSSWLPLLLRTRSAHCFSEEMHKVRRAATLGPNLLRNWRWCVCVCVCMCVCIYIYIYIYESGVRYEEEMTTHVEMQLAKALVLRNPSSWLVGSVSVSSKMESLN